MQTVPTEAFAERVLAEIEALIGFYGLDRTAVRRVIDDLRPHLDGAELTLTARGFELTLSGQGDEAAGALAAVGRRHGVNQAVIEAFFQCNAALPRKGLGLKASFAPGAEAPTLHHRTVAPKEDVLLFLSTLRPVARAVPSLSRALEADRSVYGLCFVSAGEDLAVRVCASGGAVFEGDGRRVGFVSHRVEGKRASREVRRYLPGVPWEAVRVLGGPWPRIVDFAEHELGCAWADVGLLESEGRAAETKLYVSRGEVPARAAPRLDCVECVAP